MQLRSRTGPVHVTRCPGSVPGACFAVRSPLNQVPSLHPLRRRSLGLVHGLQQYYAPVRLLAPVHHRLRLIAFPMRAVRISACRSVARPPRFRRVPFLRDVFFDHGRASAPRIAVPHMLPSTLLTVSASATLELSRLNSTPHRIVVYASQPTSPPTTQHSLPGTRYGLPAPVFHRLDRASFAWRTSKPQIERRAARRLLAHPRRRVAARPLQAAAMGGMHTLARGAQSTHLRRAVGRVTGRFVQNCTLSGLGQERSRNGA